VQRSPTAGSVACAQLRAPAERQNRARTNRNDITNGNTCKIHRTTEGEQVDEYPNRSQQEPSPRCSSCFSPQGGRSTMARDLNLAEADVDKMDAPVPAEGEGSGERIGQNSHHQPGIQMRLEN
jgi:hypothetical protein